MRKKSVTIVDVGRAAGVSPSTVSLVLRGDSSISAPTVTRVKAAMEELGYVYNRGAAALREAQTRMIGTVVHDLANDTMTEIALGANVASRALGYVQILGHTDDDLDAQREVIKGMREYGLRGLIVSPARGTQVADLGDGMTVVQVGRRLAESNFSSVTSDNEAGISAAVAHLTELGHREIAFIGGRGDTETFRRRTTAFRTALHDLGITPGQVIESPPTQEGGVAAIRAVLAGAARPTGVICFNDVVAFGVYDGLRAAGLEPGRDLSVVGFDDVAASRLLYPPLTSVSIHAREMGASAVRLLIDLLAGNRDGPVELLAPVDLRVRESCRPPVR